MTVVLDPTSPALSTREQSLAPTARTTLKRHPERGHHERALIDAVLDEGLLCHVAASIAGVPHVLPFAHARLGDAVYLHGARGNQLLRALLGGEPACLTVTLLDGLVFARSAFAHSMNFRSVVLFGSFSEVTDRAEKVAALDALMEHLAVGRSQEARAANDDELRSTLVVKLTIAEGSAKVRSGPPLDAAKEPDSSCWAGELPLRLCAGVPIVDPNGLVEADASPAVWRRASTLGATAPLGAVHEARRSELLISTDSARLDFAFVHRFLARESYWARDVGEDVQRRAMQQSLCFGLYRDEAQIGFARVVTDLGRFAYLADVFVAESERGQGLGRWLVQEVLAHPALSQVERWLLGTADAHGLYAKFGFVPAPEGRFMVGNALTSSAGGPALPQSPARPARGTP